MTSADKKPVAVAIDGPSGAGKSTIARRLAGELGFLYIDTGALYRALGYHALQNGVAPGDAAGVEALLPSTTAELRHIGGEQRVFINGTDVSDSIRTPEVSMAASAVSALPAVRAFLLAMQRDTAARQDVIMDGRDIGTVVLPGADVKIFLTASPEERARRRFLELREKGLPEAYEDVLADMIKRDRDDSSRAAAPLKQADDAVPVDTTGYTLDEAVAALRDIVTKKTGRASR